MTDYVKSTNFTSKDSLATGNPLKLIKGAEFDTEFNNIATAVASKSDNASPSFTGTPTAPTAAAGTNSTQVATTAFVQTTVATATITGEIKMWATATAPTGYLLCNGAAVSRTTYAALYAVIGTTYGSGDGSTTFNLPNFTNRMPIGGGDLYANGATGGSKDAIVVAHTHTGTTASDGAHSHTYTTKGALAVQSGSATPCWTSEATASTSTAGAHTHTFTTASTGSSGTNANLPPYLAVRFIIKT